MSSNGSELNLDSRSLVEGLNPAGLSSALSIDGDSCRRDDLTWRDIYPGRGAVPSNIVRNTGSRPRYPMAESTWRDMNSEKGNLNGPPRRMIRPVRFGADPMADQTWRQLSRHPRQPWYARFLHH
ncbi:hypothetical protein KKE78_01955 [Patescibacteria group bacterium]|nr:hypothetical protein [Patescibacteria group bacterium]